MRVLATPTIVCEITPVILHGVASPDREPAGVVLVVGWAGGGDLRCVGRAALGEGNKSGGGFSRWFKPQVGHRFGVVPQAGRVHARPFVGVFAKSISSRFVNFWR